MRLTKHKFRWRAKNLTDVQNLSDKTNKSTEDILKSLLGSILNRTKTKSDLSSLPCCLLYFWLEQYNNKSLFIIDPDVLEFLTFLFFIESFVQSFL